MFETTYRSAKRGTISSPLQVRSSGYYRVLTPWRDIAIRKYFLELFWCISGSGTFYSEDGSSFILSKDHCCCYFPGDYHQICANDDFEFCWLTFDGVKSEQLIDLFSLTRLPWNAGNCPQELFAELRQTIKKPGIVGELRSSIIGYEILAKAKNPDSTHDTSLVERFIEIIDSEFSNPLLCIDKIAEKLGVHRSTLNRNIFSACRKSPKEYLTEFRMQQALSLLSSTTLSVKEISERTGFSSPNYFGKVFLFYFGRTPTAMRNSL